jgi:putative FmdB family regulatory protein
MPIYAYKCESCGFAKDALQKISDAPLSVCPSCGADTFRKQVTAAGFQLKGSGWYVTDFRGGNSATSAPATDAKTDAKPAEGATAKTEGAAAPASAPAPAAAPAPSTGSTGGSTGGSSSGSGH